MNSNGNPYPEMIIDECSGISVPSVAHRIWAEGYEAGRRETSAEDERH